MATVLKVSPRWLIVRAARNRRNPGERSARISGDGSGRGGSGDNALRPMNPGLFRRRASGARRRALPPPPPRSGDGPIRPGAGLPGTSTAAAPLGADRAGQAMAGPGAAVMGRRRCANRL